MSRADGPVFAVASDDASHALLWALASSQEPMTQRQLTSELPYDSSTVSRRMAELESLGLVHRDSGHAPYSLRFRAETLALLRAGAELGRVARERQAQDLATDIEHFDRVASALELTTEGAA